MSLAVRYFYENLSKTALLMYIFVIDIIYYNFIKNNSNNMIMTRKDLTKAFFTALITIGFTACCNDTQPIGSWAWDDPTPGEQKIAIAFKLEENGVASSINMATLVYKSWEQKGDTLLLTGESIGNGQTIQFCDTLKIDKLTADSLIVQRTDKHTVKYYKIVSE